MLSLATAHHPLTLLPLPRVVHRSRRPRPRRLRHTPLVVEAGVPPRPPAQLGHRLVTLPVHVLVPHAPPPPPPLAVDRLAPRHRPGGHLPRAVGRAGGGLLVEQPHQPHVLGRPRSRLIGEARPSQAEPLARPPHAPTGGPGSAGNRCRSGEG